MVLHRDELCPAMLLGGKLHRGELIGPHGAGPNVSHFPGLNEVMKCFHGLFNRYAAVVAMNLQKVKIIGTKSLQGGIDGGEDGLTG